MIPPGRGFPEIQSERRRRSSGFVGFEFAEYTVANLNHALLLHSGCDSPHEHSCSPSCLSTRMQLCSSPKSGQIPFLTLSVDFPDIAAHHFTITLRFSGVPTGDGGMFVGTICETTFELIDSRPIVVGRNRVVIRKASRHGKIGIRGSCYRSHIHASIDRLIRRRRWRVRRRSRRIDLRSIEVVGIGNAATQRNRAHTHGGVLQAGD